MTSIVDMDPGYELIRRIAYATAKRANMALLLQRYYRMLIAIDIETRD